MPNESRLSITIDSRSAEQKSKDLETALGALDKAGVRVTSTTATAGKTFVEAGRGARTGAGGVDEMGRSIKQTDSAAASAAATMKRMFLAATAGFSIMHVIDVADSWGQMASRVKQATSSQDEYNLVMKRTADSARETYRSLDESRELFVRTSQAIRGLGFSLEQSIDLTDSFSALLVTNAASGERGAAAINAYSKAIQTGKIDSLSWQSILQTIPSVVDKIAESSGKSAQEIRKLGIEGKLALGDLNKALLGSLDENMKAVRDMPTTVRDALQNLGNAFQEYIGWQNEAKGATSALASGIGFLGENFETVADVVGGVAATALLLYTSRTIGSTAASISATVASVNRARATLAEADAQVISTAATLSAMRAGVGLTGTTAQLTAATVAHTAALGRQAAAQAAVATVGRSLLGVLGGPVGLGITVALAAGSFLMFSGNANAAEKSANSLRGSVDLLTTSFDKMGQSALENTKLTIEDELVSLGQTIAVTKIKLESLGSQMNAIPDKNSPLYQQMYRQMMDLAQSYEETTGRAAGLRAQLEKIAGLLSAPVNVGIDQTSAAFTKFESQINRQIALVGKSGSAAQLRYDLEHGLLGEMSDDEKELASAKINTLDASEKAEAARHKGAKATASESKEIDNLLKTLREQSAVLGMTDHEAAKYRISMMAGTQAQKDRALALLDTVSAYKENIDVMREQRNLAEEISVFQSQQDLAITGMGMGDRRRAQLEQEYAVQEDFAKRRRELDNAQLAQSTRISKEAYDRQVQYLSDAEEQKIAIVRDSAQRRMVEEQNWVTGVSRALENYADKARDVSGQTEQAFTGLFDGLADAGTKWAMGMKVSMDDVLQNFVGMLIKMQMQAAASSVFQMLGGAIGNMFGPTPAPAGVTPGVDWVHPNAKGGVYDSPSLSAYSNQIHDTPKMFAFAKGAGVFGEAGPEAIMPLKRGPDGSLGVQAQGRSGGDVTVNIINQSSQPVTASQPKISMDAMGRMVVDVMISDLRRNGPYARQLKGGM